MEPYILSNHTVAPSGNHSSNHKLFLLLLIGALLVSAATAYVLVTTKSNTPLPAPPLTLNENPFEPKAAPANPFANSTPEPDTVNPFVSTGEDNPFSQFDYAPASDTQSSDQYQNPF